MLDQAATYIARDSRAAAERLVIQALEAAASLDISGERGRIVPELDIPTVREISRRLTAFTLTPRSSGGALRAAHRER